MYLKIIRTKTVAENAVSIYFEKPDAFAVKAGQHGLFSFSINGERFKRTYSFHTAPDESELGITVRAINNGIVSNFLQNIRPANSIQLEAIGGSFTLEANSTQKRHLIMFAAGAGITPIFPMIKTLLVHEPQASLSLIYSNKNSHRIIFRDELHSLQAAFPDRLKVYHVLTQPESAPADFSIFYKGRLSLLITRQILKKIRSEVENSIEYFACGPNDLMDIVERAIRTVDPVASLQKEVFFTGNAQTEFDFDGLVDREIILHVGGDEKLVIVKRGQSILQATREHNISVLFSCTEGQCGTCRAKLISGDVKHRKNHILTLDELNAGYILLCQGFPVSDGVTIRTSL